MNLKHLRSGNKISTIVTLSNKQSGEEEVAAGKAVKSKQLRKSSSVDNLKRVLDDIDDSDSSEEGLPCQTFYFNRMIPEFKGDSASLLGLRFPLKDGVINFEAKTLYDIKKRQLKRNLL